MSSTMQAMQQRPAFLSPFAITEKMTKGEGAVFTMPPRRREETPEIAAVILQTDENAVLQDKAAAEPTVKQDRIAVPGFGKPSTGGQVIPFPAAAKQAPAAPPQVLASWPCPATVRLFMLAGRATVTLTSERTGSHLSFRVTKARKGGKFSVDQVGGLREFIGTIDAAHLDFRPAYGRAAGTCSDTAIRAFAYWWRHIAVGAEAPQVVARHMGTCGRCARPLTDPISIDIGIGPDCWQVMNGGKKRRKAKLIADAVEMDEAAHA